MGGEEQEVAVHRLAAGDTIRARPGDHVAADGVILSGQSSLNEASITGESLPVDKQPGDEVFAGTMNLTGVLDIRVTRAGQDTTLGRVRELILAAEQTRPRIGGTTGAPAIAESTRLECSRKSLGNCMPTRRSRPSEH
jgi:Cd2+/Zn2+-exporting ATPase